jgi:methyltransferase-like protein
LSDRPKASDMARFQAHEGARVTNRLHETVSLDDFQRQLLCELDGTRDRAALADSLSERIGSGKLVIHHEGRRVHEPAEVRRVVEETLETSLENLTRLALLLE